MSFCCVCYDVGPNKSFEIQKEDPKYLTTIDILKKVDSDYNSQSDDRDISTFIWYRTSRCAVNLKDSEYPLTNYPSLVLSEKPDIYETLPESLQIYTSLASTEIQNGHPGYSIFYLDVKHSTGHNIPRLYIPVLSKKMSRASSDLYAIVNESFAAIGSVETKAIYKGNGEAFTQLSSVHAVFDELQELDKSQKDLENSKKKNNEDIEAAKKKNVQVEVEFSESALQKLAQRSSLSEEILTTEKQYLECLNAIDQYWAPKLKEGSLLTDEEHDYIFKDIKTILSSHQTFCSTLEKAVKGYASEFGRLFLTYAPFFKISAGYISKYSLINKMIEKKVRESDEFSQKIDDLAKEAPQSKTLNDLTSYLIQPVKRFPYYSTFLKNIIKITPNNHPDAPFLPLAKKEVADFITQVEEKADSTTKSAILMNIQMSNSDGFDYVTPQRKLTQSFPVSYILNQSLSSNQDKQNNELQEKQGYFHVCNDYVFLVNQDTSKCVYKSPLLQFHYLNSPEQNKITVSTIKDTHVQSADEYVTKSYDVQFQNEEDQNNFFSLIEPQAEQTAESIKLPNHSFLWKVKKTNTELHPVSGHASVFNGNEHVFFGGCGNGDDEYYSNFVLYNNEDVSEIQSGIKGRKFHTLTNVNNKLFVIGGETTSGQKSGKILVYDGENKGWTAIDCPELSQQSCHTAAANGKDEIIVYGGIPSFDEIYSINTTTYEVKKLPTEDSQSQDQKKIPTNRYCHSAVIHDNKMYVYGGRSTDTDEILSDLWSFDLSQNKWNLIKWDLLPRSSHSAHVIGDEMVVIGGEGSNQSFAVNLNDSNVIFIDEYGNLPTTLIGSSVSYDPTSKNIVVYGGRESYNGPSTAALYELKMNQDWQDSINDNQEVVERDIVTDLNPNFIEIDEDGTVKEVPNPEDAEEGVNNANEEEEVEIEVDLELGEEDGTEDIGGNENNDQIPNDEDVVDDFNLSDDKDDEIEGGDNQNANGYSNDMNFDEIIDDIKEDERNDEKLDQELLDFNDENSNQDQEQQRDAEEEETTERDNDQEDDADKVLTEPNEEEDKDLYLDEFNEEEEDLGESAEGKKPWELASDDIKDDLSDDKNDFNQFEPDEDKVDQNGGKDEGNQFEPDEDNVDQNSGKDEENQFKPDEDELDSNNEEEEEEAESNIPDSNENLSDSELETPDDKFDENEINDFIEGVNEAEEELDEAQKIQDQQKSDEQNEDNIGSELDTGNLSEDLDESNENLSTNSEEEEEENDDAMNDIVNDSENKIQDESENENELESDHLNSDNADQKVSSSSHRHHHHSSSSPSRHHHHHSSSHGHSHSHHHSSRRDSSDYLHGGQSSSHGRGESDNNMNGMDDSNNSSSSMNDIFGSSNSSNSSSFGGGSGSHTPTLGVKKPKISKEKKKELERRKNSMNDQSSDFSSSSLSPSVKKHHKHDKNSGLSFDDSDDSAESNAPAFSNKDKIKNYRFTTFSIQKTNCSYLQNNQDSGSSYGGYQSPSFSQRRSGGGGSSSNYGSASRPNRYGGSGMSSFGSSNAASGNSSYYSPSKPRYSNATPSYSPTPSSRASTSRYSNTTPSYTPTSSSKPMFTFSMSPRKPNFDLETSVAFDDDSYNYGSPTKSKYSNYGSSPANRNAKNKQFLPSDFINDSPFSKKNRSNNPLYASSSSYGPRRHNDE